MTAVPAVGHGRSPHATPLGEGGACRGTSGRTTIASPKGLALIEVGAMNDTDIRLSVAQARRRLREIELEVGQILVEDRLFHRSGFGSDVHDIQLSALRTEKRDLEAE